MEFANKKKIEARYTQMEHDADNWLPVWKDLKRWGNPTRGFFDGDDPRKARTIDQKRILNNKFIRALRTAAAGLHSGLTSPSRPWFKLTVGDPEMKENAAVMEWLDDVENRIYAVMNISNIYKVLPMMYAELLLFGVAAAPIEEDIDRVFNCKSLTCGQYYLDVDDYGRVNAFARRIDMNVGQLVNVFGYDNCPTDVKNAWNNDKLNKMYTVRHLIEPNDDRIKGQKDFRNKPYRSIYWIPGKGNDVLRVGGYDEFPIIAPRWEVTKTTDIYGVSPAMYAMGDQKTLQEMERRGLMGLAKMVDPPITVTGTSKSINTMPGGVTPYDPLGASADGGARATYQVNIDFNALSAYVQRTEARIDEMLYVDLFKMILNSEQTQPITAREVVEKHEEKMMNLGPVLESMNQELHAPLIKRIFNIMMRGGLLPDPPPEMDAQMLRVEFISVLAQAQQMVATTAIQQGLGFIGNVAGLFPEALDTVNIDEAAIDYMRSNGMPAKCIRSKEEIDGIRQQRQQQQQMQQQAQDLGNLAQGAKILSDAKMDGNNALTAITGMGGGAGV